MIIKAKKENGRSILINPNKKRQGVRLRNLSEFSLINKKCFKTSWVYNKADKKCLNVNWFIMR